MNDRHKGMFLIRFAYSGNYLTSPDDTDHSPANCPWAICIYVAKMLLAALAILSGVDVGSTQDSVHVHVQA